MTIGTTVRKLLETGPLTLKRNHGDPMIRVIFVCLGNICRSPMAEAVFTNLVKEAVLADKISVDSAGTGSWHVGERAHPGTLNILKKHDISYEGRARQFHRSDLNRFTYVLAMDVSNLQAINSIAESRSSEGNGPTVQRFLHYANEAGTVNDQEVPDPYYTGDFGYVYDLVTKGAQALLDHIRKEHDL